MSTFKRTLLSAAALVPLLISGTAHAQSWSLSGNAIATGDYLGTSNSQDLPIHTNGLERMKIMRGGMVGVGTSTPGASLHIRTAPSDPQLRLDEGGANVWDLWAGVDLNFRGTVGGTLGTWLQFNGGNNINVGPGSQMRVLFGGGTTSVGIGTLAPSAKLTVAGDITPQTNCSFTIGSSGQRWNTIYACNGTIQTSDASMKENFQSLPYGLNTVMQLHPVSFTWKDDPGYGRKLGLIAQELQQLVPEVVKAGEEGGSMGVYYSDLIPVMVKAIQDQQKKIEHRAAENRVLREQLNTRAARIAQVEAALQVGTTSESGADAR